MLRYFTIPEGWKVHNKILSHRTEMWFLLYRHILIQDISLCGCGFFSPALPREGWVRWSYIESDSSPSLLKWLNHARRNLGDISSTSLPLEKKINCNCLKGPTILSTVYSEYVVWGTLQMGCLVCALSRLLTHNSRTSYVQLLPHFTDEESEAMLCVSRLKLRNLYILPLSP